MTSSSIEALTTALSQRQKLVLIICLGILVRGYLFTSTSAHTILRDRPELSTPQTSFRRLQEGVFTHRHGFPDTSFHSTIHTLLFSHAFPIDAPLASSAIWTIIDVISALLLLKVSNGLGAGRNRAAVVVSSYLLNPYIIATCIAKSTTSIDNLVVIGAIALGAHGHVQPSAIALAIATHLSPYALLLFPSIVQLGMSAQRDPPTNRRHLPTLVLAAFTLGTVYMAVSWIYNIPLVTPALDLLIKLPDLAPNSGMWWYFFTEIFDHFRVFFLAVFQLHILSYLLPLSLRLKDYPAPIVLVMFVITAAWKSYPCLGDLGMGMALLSCYPDVVSELRHPLFTASVYLYTALLLPLLHALWLLTGTGNANFFYAATMVHGLNTSLAIVDVVGAIFRSGYERRFPQQWRPKKGEPRGDARRHTEIQIVQLTSES